MAGKKFCMALSVDVDRFDDKYLVRHLSGVLHHDDGREVQVPGELRVLCFHHRNLGHEVIPPCDHVDEAGRCLGHEQPEEP